MSGCTPVWDHLMKSFAKYIWHFAIINIIIIIQVRLSGCTPVWDHLVKSFAKYLWHIAIIIIIQVRLSRCTPVWDHLVKSFAKYLWHFAIIIIIQVRLSRCTPVRDHLVKSFTLQLNVNTIKMINTSTDDLEALRLVDAMKLRQPIKQLCAEPSTNDNIKVQHRV